MIAVTTRAHPRTRAARGRALVLALLLALAGCASGDAGTRCSTLAAGTVPTLPAPNLLVIPVELGGRPAAMLVDTGAQTSLLLPEAASRLGLPLDHSHPLRIQGMGGSFVDPDDVRVSSIRFGAVTTGPAVLPVAELPGHLDRLPTPVDGILGLDALRLFDLDIDRPGGHVTFYLRGGCARGDAPVWDGRSARLGLMPGRRGFLVARATIAGHPLEAMIDTGAQASLLSEQWAKAALHLAPAAFEHDPAVPTDGVDRTVVIGRLHRVGTVRLGPATFHDARLVVAPVHLPVGDMLVGEDVLRHNRVWLSAAGAVAFFHAPDAPH